MNPGNDALALEDPEAREKLFEELRPRIYKTAVYFLGYQDPEADDVVQETLMIAFSKRGEYDSSKGGFYNWASHICAKVCLRRMARRRRWVMSAEEDFEALMASRSSAAQAEREAARESEDRAKLLRGHIGALEGHCPPMLRLRAEEGKSYAEIGKILSIPLGTVMSRLARCKEALKQRLLKDREFGFSA